MNLDASSKVIRRPDIVFKIKYNKVISYMRRNNVVFRIMPEFAGKKYICWIFLMIYDLIFVKKHNFTSPIIVDNRYRTQINSSDNNKPIILFAKPV